MGDLAAVTAVEWGAVTDWVIGTPLLIAIVVTVGIFVRWLVHRLIRRVVATATSKRAEKLAARWGGETVRPEGTQLVLERQTARATTMGALLRSVTTFVVFTVAGLTVLSIIGIPLGPMLASASVGGVALAFGAQSLVKDFLSGVFMIVEDQYGVGDLIDTGEVIGTVENVSLRVTQLRDADGVTWYVRNGEIIRIGNKSQGWSTAIIDAQVAYDEDVERVVTIIKDVVSAMHDEPPWDDKLLEEPQVMGIESIGNGAVTIRVIAKTVANEHLGVQREMRERIKGAFDEKEVRGPVVPGLPYGGMAPPT